MNEASRHSGAEQRAPHVFLSLGFRPLYILGTAWALLSVALWIFLPSLIPAPFFPVAWHAHEMLWGFIATIATGFLLTASATWTGHNPMQGKPLKIMCLAWIGARLAYLTGGDAAFLVGVILETTFFLYSAYRLACVVLRGKSLRNYGVPVLVLGLGLSNLLFLQASWQGDYLGVIDRFNTGMLLMAVLTILVARRVIPFFAGRMVPGLNIPLLVNSGRMQLVLGSIAIAAGLTGQKAIVATSLAVVGLIGLVQLIRWRPLAVIHKPMLWILYLGYLGLNLGLLTAAAHATGLTDSALFAHPAGYVHIIGMGGFAVLIIGMVTRTALGHTGRPLALDRTMLASYWFMITAVVLRLGALIFPGIAGSLLHASAAAWVVSLGLYLYRYVPILTQPRIDARPSPAPAASTTVHAVRKSQIGQ